LKATGDELATLSAAEIVALNKKNLDVIDIGGNIAAVSAVQAAALVGAGALRFAAEDVVTVSDTGAGLAGLTAAQIGALKASGVDAIDASDNRIDLSLAQFKALGSLALGGNDVIKVQGTQAADTFTGRGGNHAFFGLNGNDTIKGSAGHETLSGGSGNDVLYGGTGRDTFVFNTALNARTNKDRIMDWNKTYDTIQLENAVFKKLTKTGTLSASFFKLGSKALDANDYIGYDRATGDLWYDSNGSAAGGQVVFANIGKGKAIAYNDFVVI